MVALVGYTNAGKSTLLNALSDAQVYVADQLFATLDPTTRRVKLPGGREILLTDTVGFIQKLPTTLIAAFRATLEEIAEADLLVHIVDITHENVVEQVAAVMEALAGLHATEQPIVTALNKTDRLPAGSDGIELADLPNSVLISALKRSGLDDLLARIEAVLDEDLVAVDLLLPYPRGDLLALFHQRGVIHAEAHAAEGTRVIGKLPASLLPRFDPYIR